MKKTEVKIEIDKSIDADEALKEYEKIFEKMKGYETWILARADKSTMKVCGRVESRVELALMIAKIMIEVGLGPTEIVAALLITLEIEK